MSLLDAIMATALGVVLAALIVIVLLVAATRLDGWLYRRSRK